MHRTPITNQQVISLFLSVSSRPVESRVNRVLFKCSCWLSSLVFLSTKSPVFGIISDFCLDESLPFLWYSLIKLPVWLHAIQRFSTPSLLLCSYFFYSFWHPCFPFHIFLQICFYLVVYDFVMLDNIYNSFVNILRIFVQFHVNTSLVVIQVRLKERHKIFLSGDVMSCLICLILFPF